MKYTISLLLLMLIFSSCKKETEDNSLQPKDLMLSPESKQIVEAGNAFGFSLLNKLLAENAPNDNLMISPVSISMALSMTYNGAETQTSDEMSEVLNFKGISKDEVNNAFQSFIPQLETADMHVNLSIANSIWYRNTLSVKRDFLNTNSLYFGAEVNASDFNNPNTVNHINDWVSMHTQGKITKIIQEINPDLMMILINAVYFKGIWHYKFDESDTQMRPFRTGSGDTVQTETMNTEADVQYYENDSLKMAELPYGRGNYAMLLALPKDGYSLDNFAKTLSSEKYNELVSGLGNVGEVNVFLPKFTFEYEEELKKHLSALGMPTAFSASADFTSIADTPLHISQVLHKSYIEVNEEGTEAAAVTAVFMNRTSAGSGFVFRADRPFFFAIRERSSGAVIFCGIVNNPKN